jgi:hypothetical protein
MDNEYNEFSLKFASSEKEFLYNEGPNRGHSLTYSKVNRCLFLSSEAKQLYTNISEYAFNGKRDCFPSQLALRLQLGWCKNTIRKFTYELRDARLIALERTGGGNYVYHLSELHTIPTVAHSEFVHEVLEQYRKEHGENTFKALETYKKTSLCDKANKNPVGHEATIEKFFQAYFAGETLLPVSEPVVYKPQPEIPQHVPGMPRRITAAPVNADEIRREADPSKPEKASSGRKHTSWRNVPVEDWNTNHFTSYFADKYLEVMKLPMIGAGMKERGQLKKLIDLYGEMEVEGKPYNGRELLKRRIEVYIDSDFFSPKGISNFCSNFVQGMITQYLNTGSFDRKKQSNLAPQEDSQETKDEFADLAARRRAQLLGGVQ